MVSFIGGENNWPAASLKQMGDNSKCEKNKISH
jgi:hypothetical protein